MKSPVMIPGKYKVTLRYFYANSMKNFRSYGSGSNGGQIDVEFPEMENVVPYLTLCTPVFRVTQTLMAIICNYGVI